MRSLRALAASSVGVGSIMAAGISGSALAQDAVQWRIEDGGNGHWYAYVPTLTSWTEARAAALGLGGDLSSLTSIEEVHFWSSRIPPNAGNPLCPGCTWIGAVQARGASEPAGDWTWSDGTPWGFSYWNAGEPNDLNGEDYAYGGQGLGPWNDVGNDGNIPFIIEWSADCNADGIIDYGQIRAGDLADTNANNIPDCCEQGFDCRLNAVEWRVEDDGNGHWYAVVSPSYEARDWYLVKAAVEAKGGYLASITSAAENQFLALQPAFAPIDSSAASQFWLGGIRDGSQWSWVDGSPWKFTSWDSSPSCYEPNSQPDGSGRWLGVHCRRDGSLRWNDLSTDLMPEPPFVYLPMGYVIEYSADCNADGIVDYGQIRAGELVDVNANNIPDCCEAAEGCNPCLADIDESGAVNAVDLAAILTVWGTSGGKYPRADINNDGEVNGPDLAAVLSAWGPCP